MRIRQRQLDRVWRFKRWLCAVYDLELPGAPSLVEPELARRLIPEPAPESGLLVVEEGDALALGIFLDPQASPSVILEETSHWVCAAWHARVERPVSQLWLELQADVDRFVYAHLNGGRPFVHLERWREAPWLGPEERSRYRTATGRAHRICRGLARRHPARRDTDSLLRELRRFWRAPGEARLHWRVAQARK